MRTPSLADRRCAGPTADIEWLAAYDGADRRPHLSGDMRRSSPPLTHGDHRRNRRGRPIADNPTETRESGPRRNQNSLFQWHSVDLLREVLRISFAVRDTMLLTDCHEPPWAREQPTYQPLSQTHCARADAICAILDSVAPVAAADAIRARVTRTAARFGSNAIIADLLRH